MQIWRKAAGAAWVEGNGHEIERIAPGRVAVIEVPGRTRMQVEVCCANAKQAARLVARFGGRTEKLASDWRRSFLRQEASRPIHIGKRLIVHSGSSLTAKTAARLLTIPAGMAFGTGDHATTAMCARFLEQRSRAWSPGWTLLDAGTGTGLLALAAKCFGAGKVLAFDFDPDAVKVATGNARANKIEGVRFLRRDVLKWKPPGSWDVITANLFCELLVQSLGQFHAALRPGGHVILSGVLRTQEAELLRALDRHRFTEIVVRRRGKWIAAAARRDAVR